MHDYEVLMLRKACEELSLRVVILSSRLDDSEAVISQLRLSVFSLSEQVAKLLDANGVVPAIPDSASELI